MTSLPAPGRAPAWWTRCARGRSDDRAQRDAADRARRGRDRHRDHRPRSRQGADRRDRRLRLAGRAGRPDGAAPHAGAARRADPGGGHRASTASTTPRSPRRQVSPRSGRSSPLSRRRGRDRPHARLRSRRAQARMRARRHRLEAPARARHAAAGRGRRPDLAGYSLDQLAAWLGVDGRAAATRRSATRRPRRRSSCALLPKLRERGIRTLAEAEQACRALTDVLEQQHRAGWIEPVEAPSRGMRSARSPASTPIPTAIASRRDARAAEIRRRRAAIGDALEDAWRRRASRRCSCCRQRGGAAGRGRRRPASSPSATSCARSPTRRRRRSTMPVGDGHEPPARGGAGRRLRLSRDRAHEPAQRSAISASPTRTGTSSARCRRAICCGCGPRTRSALGDEIDRPSDVPALGARLGEAAAGRRRAARGGRLGPRRRRRDLARARRAHAPRRRPRRARACGRTAAARRPAPMRSRCWARPAAARACWPWTRTMRSSSPKASRAAPRIAGSRRSAAHVADILHEVGVPYCQGGVMAKNPPGAARSRPGASGSPTGSAARARTICFRSISSSTCAPVHGDARLANTLWRDAFDAARGEIGFAKLLAEAAGAGRAGPEPVRRLPHRQGRIDLKKSGLFGIVTLARVLAIRHHVVERATPARLAGIKALGLGAESDLDALIDGAGRLPRPHAASADRGHRRGRPASNAVAVKRLTRRDRERLRAALASVSISTNHPRSPVPVSALFAVRCGVAIPSWRPARPTPIPHRKWQLLFCCGTSNCSDSAKGDSPSM